MSMPRRSPRIAPLISEATVRRSAKGDGCQKMDDLLAEITALPCPKCGSKTLILDSELYKSPAGGIVIYCTRAICGYHPWSHK